MTSLQLKAIYSLIESFASLNTAKKPHGNQKVSDTTILYIYITAFLCEQGSFRRAIRRLKAEQFLPDTVSESTFCRRIQKLRPLIQKLSRLIVIYHRLSQELFIIDACPLPILKNVRFNRSARNKTVHWGYSASFRQYFFGYKLHAVVDAQNKLIVQHEFSEGNIHDISALAEFNFELPPGSRLLADKAYDSAKHEEKLQKQQIQLDPIRKSPKWQQMTYAEGEAQAQKIRTRRKIEAVFSVLKRQMPSKIDFVKTSTFLLKITGFIIAYNMKIQFPQYFY